MKISLVQQISYCTQSKELLLLSQLLQYVTLMFNWKKCTLQSPSVLDKTVVHSVGMHSTEFVLIQFPYLHLLIETIHFYIWMIQIS